MNKPLVISLITCVLIGASAWAAKPLPAELIMPGGRTWKGNVVGRDGDWIEFTTSSSAQPIRVGASTIQELIFTLDIDQNELQRLSDSHEYAQAITILESTFAGYDVYKDIPSNLSLYNGFLMDLYYKTGAYEKTLNIATTVAADDRNPELQRKAIVFEGMALIEIGRLDEAEALFAKQGWTEDLPDDAPPEDLYITAKFMATKKEYAKAMEMVAKVVAFHSQDPEWMSPAELLCAEVYAELGMLDSADEVIREISLLYKNSFEAEQAQKLKMKVDKLRAEKKAQEKSDDDA